MWTESGSVFFAKIHTSMVLLHTTFFLNFVANILCTCGLYRCFSQPMNKYSMTSNICQIESWAVLLRVLIERDVCLSHMLVCCILYLMRGHINFTDTNRHRKERHKSHKFITHFLAPTYPTYLYICYFHRRYFPSKVTKLISKSKINFQNIFWASVLVFR